MADITIGNDVIRNRELHSEETTLFEVLNYTNLKEQSQKYKLNELTILGLKNKHKCRENSNIHWIEMGIFLMLRLIN